MRNIVMPGEWERSPRFVIRPSRGVPADAACGSQPATGCVRRGRARSRRGGSAVLGPPFAARRNAPYAVVVNRASLLGVVAVAAACSTSGRFEGDIESSQAPQYQAPAAGLPPPRHERVEFVWASEDGSSGTLNVRLPGGHTFQGNYYEITRTTLVPSIGGFYGGWYGPWYGPSWTWGGAWPYYGTVDEFVTYYTGKVVALLDDGRGEHMRCRFELLDNTRGMAGGGTGECQTSTGTRITAWFRPGEGAPVS
jgi:hypothetical protein